jgi:hypothetical protein
MHGGTGRTLASQDCRALLQQDAHGLLRPLRVQAAKQVTIEQEAHAAHNRIAQRCVRERAVGELALLAGQDLDRREAMRHLATCL